MGNQSTDAELLLRLGSLEQQQAEWSTERNVLIKEKEELELRLNILEQKYAECYTERKILSVEKSEFMALFESIDAGIYAIDPDTNEIIYANKKARKGLHNHNLIGQKCYRVLQGLDDPCDFCNHRQIFENNIGKAHIFEVQNNLNRKWYHCIAKAIQWPETGKMVRWEMAICIHDQKMATNALRESEKKYATLVENAKDGITIIQDGIRQYANPAMMKMLGYCQEEIVGQPYIDIVDGEHKEQFEDLFSLTQDESDSPKLYLSALVSKAGAKLDVEMSFTEIIFRNKPAHMGLIRNISERKKIEESLRQSEQRYGALLDYLDSHIPLHVGASDKDYTFIFWNKYSEKMFGYTAEEVEGKMSPALLHESEEEVLEVLRITGNGDIYDKEANWVHKNGTLVPVHCVVVPMRDADGGLVGLYGFAEDITNRKLAEIALKESEERFRNLVENSPICISIVQDDKVVYANPEQKKAFGFTSQQMTLANIHKKIHPADLKTIYQKIKKNSKKPSSDIAIDIRFRFYRESRKERSGLRWFQCRLTHFQFQGSVAVLINTIDITEAKQMRHLLDIKSKMTSLGRVAAGIAHEIRSPLTAIILFLNNLDLICRETERIEDESLDEVREIITESLDATQDIETVVKRVIDFSKPSVISRSPTPINQPLEEAIKLSAATLRNNGIILKKALTTESRDCHIDAQRFKQVFLNIINNSIQAMRDMAGPKILRIESEITSNVIIYRISDSGPGVPAEYSEKIFDPFFTTKASGSGIGLSISRRIIMDHEGAINVSQSEWDGAEFTIRVPFF